MFSLKPYTLAGFERESSVSEAAAMSTAPRRQAPGQYCGRIIILQNKIVLLECWVMIKRDIEKIRFQRTGVDVMIFKIFSPKIAKKWRF
jgi:hypothetical protein